MRPTYENIANQLDLLLNKTAIVKKFGALDHIDVWNNQLAFWSETDPIPLPAIFVSIQVPIWETSGRNTQKGQAVVGIHVVQQVLASTHFKSSDKAKGLLKFDYLCEVHIALQGFSGPAHTAMHRNNTIADESHDGLIDHVMNYSTTITDNSADDQRNLVDVAPVELDEQNDQNLVIPVIPNNEAFPEIKTS